MKKEEVRWIIGLKKTQSAPGTTTVLSLLPQMSTAYTRWTMQALRRKTKSFIDVKRPNLIRIYNQSMGGVDRADMLLSFYRNSLKTKNLYKRICFHLIDLTVVNAWLLFRQVKASDMHLSDFKLHVALGLMRFQEGMPDSNLRCLEQTTSCSPTSVAEASTSSAGVISKRALDVQASERYDGIGHWLDSCKRRTRFYCKKCCLFVCRRRQDQLLRKIPRWVSTISSRRTFAVFRFLCSWLQHMCQ